jgi:hypothetical protein
MDFNAAGGLGLVSSVREELPQRQFLCFVGRLEERIWATGGSSVFGTRRTVAARRLSEACSYT